MRYIEVEGDLFTVPESYALVHCISTDAKMGAGIAVEFKKRFKLTETIKKSHNKELFIGTCFKDGRVLNLITKDRYWHKPTKEDFEKSLIHLKQVVLENQITKIAMPKIGAGLDRLKWEDNREMIKRIFGDTQVDIAVYKQTGKT